MTIMDALAEVKDIDLEPAISTPDEEVEEELEWEVSEGGATI